MLAAFLQAPQERPPCQDSGHADETCLHLEGNRVSSHIMVWYSRVWYDIVLLVEYGLSVRYDIVWYSNTPRCFMASPNHAVRKLSTARAPEAYPRVTPKCRLTRRTSAKLTSSGRRMGTTISMFSRRFRGGWKCDYKIPSGSSSSFA